MIEHKIAKVDDKVCHGCTQNWEDECRAFSFPHSASERLSRQANNSKMNCQTRTQVCPDEIDKFQVTEDEAMTVGFLHGAGQNYNMIIDNLVEDVGWDRDRAIQVCEHLQTVDGSFGN